MLLSRLNDREPLPRLAHGECTVKVALCAIEVAACCAQLGECRADRGGVLDAGRTQAEGRLEVVEREAEVAPARMPRWVSGLVKGTRRNGKRRGTHCVVLAEALSRSKGNAATGKPSSPERSTGAPLVRRPELSWCFSSLTATLRSWSMASSSSTRHEVSVSGESAPAVSSFLS